MNKKEIENKLEKCFKRCATWSIYSGFLKGFAMITSITPLENQHSLK